MLIRISLFKLFKSPLFPITIIMSSRLPKLPLTKPLSQYHYLELINALKSFRVQKKHLVRCVLALRREELEPNGKVNSKTGLPCYLNHIEKANTQLKYIKIGRLMARYQRLHPKMRHAINQKCFASRYLGKEGHAILSKCFTDDPLCKLSSDSKETKASKDRKLKRVAKGEEPMPSPSKAAKKCWAFIDAFPDSDSEDESEDECELDEKKPCEACFPNEYFAILNIAASANSQYYSQSDIDLNDTDSDADDDLIQLGNINAAADVDDHHHDESDDDSLRIKSKIKAIAASSRSSAPARELESDHDDHDSELDMDGAAAPPVTSTSTSSRPVTSTSARSNDQGSVRTKSKARARPFDPESDHDGDVIESDSGDSDVTETSTTAAEAPTKKRKVANGSSTSVASVPQRRCSRGRRGCCSEHDDSKDNVPASHMHSFRKIIRKFCKKSTKAKLQGDELKKLHAQLVMKQHKHVLPYQHLAKCCETMFCKTRPSGRVYYQGVRIRKSVKP